MKIESSHYSYKISIVRILSLGDSHKKSEQHQFHAIQHLKILHKKARRNKIHFEKFYFEHYFSNLDPAKIM